MKRIMNLFIFCLVILFMSGCANKSVVKGPKYTILGGPDKGTFIVFAEEISELARKEQINIHHKSSKGSLENVRRINAYKDDFAIAYASHIFMARNGLLVNDSLKYKNIAVLGYLYGAQAHLVVSEQLGIDSAKDLVGSRVGVGPAGTGSFYNCLDFFTELGVWDKNMRHAIPDNLAFEYFKNNDLDAFWTMSGYPNKAVTRTLQKSGAKLINLYSDGQSIGFFDKYPYYAKTVIPANTYPGIHEDTPTFQNSALLIAHRNVPNDVVIKLLSLIYSEESIRRLEKSKNAAKFMRDNDGSYGISTPLHSGAIQYYKDLDLK